MNFRPRIIPVLLLQGKGLVKSVQFKNHRYIGDPINAVRIFNDLKADELVFLDILATREKRLVSLDFVRNVGEEANMPFAVGGGIKTLEDIQAITAAGAEKVVIGTEAARNPGFIKQASDSFGSSTIVVCLDVKKKLLEKEHCFVVNGTQSTGLSPVDFAKQMEDCGAGEIIIQSIPQDGMMQGYDIPLIRKISEAVTIPVVALGGAGKMEDLQQAFREGYANGLAAGSMFVFHGLRRAVLINYPEIREINKEIVCL